MDKPILRRVALYEGYLEALESATTSDFPNYLQLKQREILLDSFKGKIDDTNWRKISRRRDLADFEEYTSMRLGEADDLEEVPESGDYKDSHIDELPGPRIRLRTFGRTYSVSRYMILADDFNRIREQPERFGRAAARTFARRFWAMLESNPVCYDGKNLFHSDRGNVGVAALTPDDAGMVALEQARYAAWKTAVDDRGVVLNIYPRYLVVHPVKEPVARVLTEDATLPSKEYTGVHVNNRMRGKLEVIADAMLTDEDAWYLLPDPSEMPVIDVAFLNGKETPDLLLADPAVRLVLGGNDPYSFEFDEIKYKVRHDYGFAPAEWRGAYKSTGVGEGEGNGEGGGS